MWKWIKALNPFESDNYAPWMREEIAALRAELDAAEIELADKAFYVREFAAVSAERDALKAAQPQSTPLSDEMIERMAMAAREGFYGSTVSHRDWDECSVKDLWCDAIRAALAAVGPQYNPADVAFNSRVPELEKKIDNQRMNLRQRPEGLPTADDLDKAWVEKYDLPSFLAYATFAIDYIAPWLREPVGWECDMTDEQCMEEMLAIKKTQDSPSSPKFRDLVLSRIRPVFECKECADWKQMFIDKNNEYQKLEAAVAQTYIAIKPVLTATARAALEATDAE